MEVLTGRSIGPYQIVSLIGRGGMGTVYLARDTRLDRQVALKFVRADRNSPDDDRRLLIEARTASALNHPGICQIFDVGSEGGASWIAMEYVEGRPLAETIPGGGMHPEQAARIIRELAAALEHAHARGVIHRDLKSGNVVCDSAGHPKILDFGISRRVAEAVAHDVTRTGPPSISPAVEGSLPYMAPEVLSGAAADQRADLWSIGVLFYELLTGRLPFRAASTLELIGSILEARVPPLPPHVPAHVGRIVTRLLARAPSDRYASAVELIGAMDAEPPSQDPPSPRRGRAALMAGAGLALAGGLAGYLLWTRSQTTPLSFVDQHLVSSADVSHRAPSFNPDATMVAVLVPDASGVAQIRVVNLRQGTSIPVTSGTTAAGRPRWSPKGDQIVYAVDGLGIWSVSSIGGEPRRILPNGFNPNWSRDGSRLVFEDRLGVWMAAADGTNVRMVQGSGPQLYQLPRAPALSPDGSLIAFFRSEAGPNGDLWVIPSSGGSARRLTSDVREGGWPVWTPDGGAIVYSSARGGSRTLWQVALHGGEPVALTVGTGEDDQPDLSADGRTIAYTNVRNTWDLRVRNLATAEERSLLRRGTEMQFPIFSPDGTRIAFFGRADRAVAIFTIAPDGSRLVQLTSGIELNHQPRWGSDGRDVYFFQVHPEQSFRRVSVDGGPSVSFRPWEWTVNNVPQFDPTGRYIAYLRARGAGPSGTPEHTVIHEIATGREREWPEPHTHPAGWSGDGKSIIGTQHDGKIVICRVDDGVCRVVAAGASPVWPPGSERIYFARPVNPAAPQELWSAALDGSAERREAALGVFRPIDRFFTVSRHGLAAWSGMQSGTHEVWTATVK